ncbi:ankyrin [Melanomma pulvis-pyrius CBS 109.77]|uniref:Ankyrin n=1 Tax=Melanomma pulvis-pyrius CBS 109.77 TaxID=1314802 RepID=A0A6A6XRF4_9PLEO|nr:ankyrin [Melanomma pulvis-pyrius CBS 109.77]
MDDPVKPTKEPMPTTKEDVITPSFDAAAPSSSNENPYLPPENQSEDPPLYLENEASLRERIAQLSMQVHSDAHPLPITSYPSPEISQWARNNVPDLDPTILRRQDIVTTYFTALKKKQDEVVAALIESGVVNTETTSEDGQTPLLAAIEAGNVRTVQQLMDFDADVNAFGVVAKPSPPYRTYRQEDSTKTLRSPLMRAAETGNLTIVKLLMETYGADDALVAPDGELALRLAASNGHREIVDYLPSRRRGGWKRWKTKHRKAMKRIAKAGKGIYTFFLVFGYDMPKFFLWSIPKHCVFLPAVRGAKWLHAHRAELPERIIAWVKGLWTRLKDVPREVWLFNKYLAEFIWRGIKGLPMALKIALLWVYSGLKRAGGAIVNVFARFFSFVHTALVAVATFFRNVTLKDVWDGFKVFLHALFVDAPKKMWEWLCQFGTMTRMMLKAMWGCTGWLLWMLFRCFVEVFVYVPRKLFEILVSAGGSVGSAFREVMIWINPKRR